MRTRHPLVRRGFTLIEIITSLAILGIIGLAFVRLVISQARFTEGQMALRNARSVSRNAMNILLTDIRMVQDSGGLVSAARDSVTMRVPVAFGLLCNNTPGSTTISLLPVDSAMTALGVYAGWAYRDSVSGQYVYNDATSPMQFNSLSTGNTNKCVDNGIVLGQQEPGIVPVTYLGHTGRIVNLANPTVVSGPGHGWPVFLYQRITYRFQGSTAYPGRVGLFRKMRSTVIGSPIVDEIIAPFDASARFRFYVLNADVAVDSAPANLNRVRGLELILAGSSPRKQQGSSEAQQALVTGVFFKNRRDP